MLLLMVLFRRQLPRQLNCFITWATEVCQCVSTSFVSFKDVVVVDVVAPTRQSDEHEKAKTSAHFRRWNLKRQNFSTKND